MNSRSRVLRIRAITTATSNRWTASIRRKRACSSAKVIWAFRAGCRRGNTRSSSRLVRAKITLWAAENPPAGEPDPQAAKVFLSFGGTSVYYLVSVRRRKLGDDLNVANPVVSPTDCDTATTPNGIPDCGVLIERVVEGGDPNVSDCNSDVREPLGRRSAQHGQRRSPLACRQRDSSNSYGAPSAGSDGVTIGVRAKPDADHYAPSIRPASRSSVRSPQVDPLTSISTGLRRSHSQRHKSQPVSSTSTAACACA